MISVEEAARLYEENDSAHGFDHVLRVWQLAEQIGHAEGADMPVLQAATLLHDIGRAEQQRTGTCHAAWGAQKALEVLAEQPEERKRAVAEAIAQHRFRADGSPITLEAKILYDADKLDAIGAIGIARAYAIAGERGQRLWAEVDPEYATRRPHQGRDDLLTEEHTPVHEYLFKLIKLKDRMFTDTGRQLAVERHRFMTRFFDRLNQEVHGMV